ncbi:bifunctional oligoribonuclease/PAP phosphatase NrnA [Candidatus Poribacteria bacterium]|nr:bifunctional oligoribonuclease/PAP phosphatase NrnA [Candidatus Poribacteria bacterium]
MNNSLAEIAKFIKENDNFLISAHINPDGDSTGSQLGLFGILKKLNKKVKIIDADPIPRIYRFLPFSAEKVTEYNGEVKFDAAIILDCGDIKRVGKLPVNLESIKTIINIDHHISNDFFGNLKYVDPNASSSGELIFRLMNELNIIPDNEISSCLYSAIMTDTGGFRFENTTNGAFDAVARLITYGVKPEKICKKIYENYELNSMHLLGLALNNLSIIANGKIGCMFVTREMMKATSTTAEHTEGFVNYTRMIEGVEVGIFFRETENGTVKIGMRSKEIIDTNKIANFFGGGGHARASGCDIEGSLETVMKKVIAKVEEEL